MKGNCSRDKHTTKSSRNEISNVRDRNDYKRILDFQGCFIGMFYLCSCFATIWNIVYVTSAAQTRHKTRPTGTIVVFVNLLVETRRKLRIKSLLERFILDKGWINPSRKCFSPFIPAVSSCFWLPVHSSLLSSCCKYSFYIFFPQGFYALFLLFFCFLFFFSIYMQLERIKIM